MVCIDKNFVRAFNPNEQLVMLRLLVDADEDGRVTFKPERLAKNTKLTFDEVSVVLSKLVDDDVIHTDGDNIVICGFNGYQFQGKKKKKREVTVVSTKPLAERQHDFGMSLTPYLTQYPKEMIRAFYTYWSEPNQSQTKMRWEMEKTWSVAGRLATWAKNDKKFSKHEQRADDIQRRQSGAAAIIARLAAEEGSGA